MKRKYWVFLLIFSLFVTSNLDAQRWKLQRYEMGFSLGTTESFMDIGSHRDGISSFQINSSRVYAGTHLAFLVTQNFQTKLELGYLMLGGSDTPERDRGHVFMSQGFEHSLRFEYNILGIGRTGSTSAMFNRRGMINSFGNSNLYLFVGAGGLLSKATVRDINGDEVIGNPAYHNNMQYAFVIPAGIEYKYSFSSYFDIGFEIGGRYSFSDKIDGYHNVQASNYSDRYIVVNVKALYKIRTNRKGLPEFGSFGRGF